MEEKNSNEEEYAKALLELSKKSVESSVNKSTLGEYLSTPLRRVPGFGWRPQDPGESSRVLANLDKRKSVIFLLVFFVVVGIIAFIVLNSFSK